MVNYQFTKYGTLFLFLHRGPYTELLSGLTDIGLDTKGQAQLLVAWHKFSRPNHSFKYILNCSQQQEQKQPQQQGDSRSELCLRVKTTVGHRV